MLPQSRVQTIYNPIPPPLRSADGGDVWAGAKGKRIVTVATEHKCVLESVRDLAAEGFEPVILPVGRDGLLDLDTLRAQVPAAIASDFDTYAAGVQAYGEALAALGSTRGDVVAVFDAEWVLHAREVRRLHEKLFYRPLLNAVARLDAQRGADVRRLAARRGDDVAGRLQAGHEEPLRRRRRAGPSRRGRRRSSRARATGP